MIQGFRQPDARASPLETVAGLAAPGTETDSVSKLVVNFRMSEHELQALMVT